MGLLVAMITSLLCQAELLASRLSRNLSRDRLSDCERDKIPGILREFCQVTVRRNYLSGKIVCFAMSLFHWESFGAACRGSSFSELTNTCLHNGYKIFLQANFGREKKIAEISKCFFFKEKNRRNAPADPAAEPVPCCRKKFEFVLRNFKIFLKRFFAKNYNFFSKTTKQKKSGIAFGRPGLWPGSDFSRIF